MQNSSVVNNKGTKIWKQLLTLGYFSTGMSILIVFFTINPEELPCGLSQLLDRMEHACSLKYKMKFGPKKINYLKTRTF